MEGLEARAAEKLIKWRFFLGISVSACYLGPLRARRSGAFRRRAAYAQQATLVSRPVCLGGGQTGKMIECSSLLGAFLRFFKLYMPLTSTDLCLSAAGWVSDCGSQSTKWISECVTTPEWVTGPPGQSFWLSESAPTPMAELQDCRPSFQQSNRTQHVFVCVFLR